MPKAIITPDQDAVISEIEVSAPPDRVFQALITREQALQWGTSDAFQVIRWEMEARVGGSWRFVSKEKGSAREFDHHGKVVEIDPPRVLAYTWFANWHSDLAHETRVRWELTPSSRGTLVKVTHSGLAKLPEACTAYSQGWPGLLNALKTFSEKQTGALA
jgi:uncharacterized protein YndB with AHSA1/START domain